MTEWPTVQIWTDGACVGNPGPGGWAAVIRLDGQDHEISGGEAETTNNRMEIMAAVLALQALDRPCRVTLTSDSRYMLDGITKWVHGWQRKGWRTKSGDPVKNVDLWKALMAAATSHMVTWKWVNGHSGHPQNERADALACAAVPGGQIAPPVTLRHMVLSYKAHGESVAQLDGQNETDAAGDHELAAHDLEKAILAREIEPGLTVGQLLEIMR